MNHHEGSPARISGEGQSWAATALHPSTHIGLFYERRATKVQFSISPAYKSRKSIMLKLASRMHKNAYF